MADKKIEALAAKVNVLAEFVVALATIVHSLQRSLPQAPLPPTRWTKRAAQRETYPAKDNQIEMAVNDLQQQHEKQLLLNTIDLNQESLKEKNSCKMNISNSNIKMVGSHLDRRQKRNFVPLRMNLEKVFCILEAKGVLKPLQPKFPNFIQKGRGYCKYHQVNGHSIRECGALKNAIQNLIDQERIDPAEFDHWAAAASMPVTS